MKTEVYSWRVSADLKNSLEEEARRRKLSLSAVLDLAAREWLITSGPPTGDALGQQRLYSAVSQFIGAFAGGDADRSHNASQSVRQRLRRRHLG